MARVLRRLRRAQAGRTVPSGDGLTIHRLQKPFPMVRRLSATPAEAGPVVVSDIDKTYLDSSIERRRDLLRQALERAEAKRPIAGAPALMRAIRRPDDGRPPRPLYFITASPPQIAAAIEGRLALDGVEHDGVTYKGQLRLAARRELDQLRVQAAFKLAALLLIYAERRADEPFVLLGDDVERDPWIYALFADVCAGRIRGRALEGALLGLGVRPRYASALRELADPLPRREAVRRILVHLVRRPDGGSLAGFDARVVGYPTPAAAAAQLASDGLLSAAQVAEIAATCGPSSPIAGGAHARPRWIPGLDAGPPPP